MQSEIKNLGIGFVLGIVIASLLITATTFAATATPSVPSTTPEPSSTATLVQPSETPTSSPMPTRTFTPTPTKIVLASNTPTTFSAFSTASPSKTKPTISNVPLIITGPLTNDQQLLLYETSLRYIAQTTQDSLRLAREINGVKYGHPSNTCGPLAIAILRGAGLVSADINPHDFWLLNPTLRKDQELLNRTFPADRYMVYRFETPLNKFDWRAFPLLPGDFLYIHAGSGGNFDHMLVVSRVDKNLRAYAVTNFDTPNGFIIDEVMLYDPNDARAGIFHIWTKSPYARLGSTGFGGFELWRLRSAEQLRSP